MATQFSNALQMSNSTDALFRAWVQFIHDTLITTGVWVDPGDTGQMTIATAAHPTTTNTKVGFRIYRMDDALQATAPVFLRIDYGSGAAANTPGIWLTFGTASNGAGTITNITFNGGSTTIPTVSSGTNATSLCNSYGSAAKNRFSLLMFVRAAANDMMIMSVERSKDASGADTADGLLLTYQTDAGGGLRNTQYIVRAGGGQPPLEPGVSFTLSNQTSSAFAGNVGIGLPLHFKSVVQQPGVGIIIVNSGDFLPESTIPISLYGSTVSFQLGNSSASQVTMPVGAAGTTQRNTTRVGIRYD